MIFSRSLARQNVVILFLAHTLLSAGGFVAGNPLERRAAASSSITAAPSGPSPWISLSKGTPVTTITPVVTTIDGKATTKNAEPTPDSSAAASTTGTAPSSSPSVSLPSDDAPECQFTDGLFPPICKPANGTDVNVGETYYVTWDPRHLPNNSSVIVRLAYTNASEGGDQVWSSPPTESGWGVVSIDMDNDWLQGLKRNNLTITMLNLAGPNAGAAKLIKGPIVSLIPKPANHYKPGPPTPDPTKHDLAIGLGVGLGGAVLIVGGLCICMRKTRHIGLGNVMSRRRGYTERKSRRQRMKGIGKRRGAIRLGEDELGDADIDDIPGSRQHGSNFQDDSNPRGLELSPRGGDRSRHGRDESLGSLVNSPTEDRFATR